MPKQALSLACILALTLGCGSDTSNGSAPGNDSNGGGWWSDGNNSNPGNNNGSNPGGDGSTNGGGNNDGTDNGGGGNGGNQPDPVKPDDVNPGGMLPDDVNPENPGSVPKDPFPDIDTENEVLLRKAVYFYGAQRCGDGGNWLLADNPTDDKCHMQDGQAYGSGHDMTGGWHDAGDYIKFTLTIAWSSYVLLKVYEVFPDAFDDEYGARHEPGPNGIPDVLDQAKYAVDYLVKAHPSPDVLISRIGGNQDHGRFITSPMQSTFPVEQGGGARPVNPWGESKADIAGITAASLAMMARLWKPYDEARANTYLEHAKQIYAIGERNPGVTPDNDDYYEDSDHVDNMLCGAVELYRASNEQTYYDAAVQWNQTAGQHYWVVDWSTNSDYCRHSLVKAGYAQAATPWSNDVGSYLGKISNAQYVRGLAFFSNWGSLRYATGAAFSAALLYDITGDEKYRTFAESQLAYVKGENEYNRSFVIGFGQNYPRWPHHRNAYGYDDGDPNVTPFKYELTGALVGGPLASNEGEFAAGYHDQVHNYVGNEVTIDYNTGLVGLAAFAVALERRAAQP